MNGVRVNSFFNLLVPSFAQDQRKEGVQNTSNWKVYAAAGTAMAFSALAANWAFSGTSSSNADNDIKDLAEKVYSSLTSKNLETELKETATKVFRIIEKVFADKGIANGSLISAVSDFAQELDPMLDRFPGGEPKEIALLSASEGIWVGTNLDTEQSNEIIRSIFDNSCNELNVNCDDLIKTLTDRFNDSNLDKSVRKFVDDARKVGQYPYCENWTPENEKDLGEETLPIKDVRSEIPSQSKLISPEQIFDSYAMREKGLSQDYLNAGRVALNQFTEVLVNMGIEDEWASALAIFMPKEIVKYKEHFPEASPQQIAVLAVLDSFLVSLWMLEEVRDSAVNKFMEINCKNPEIFKDSDKGFSALFNTTNSEAIEYLGSWRNVVSNQTLFCENSN